MIRSFIHIFVVACLFISCQNPSADNRINSEQSVEHEGVLFIIGGGSRGDELVKNMTETVDFAPEDYVVVLTMANGNPERSFEGIKNQLEMHLNNPIVHYNFAKGEEVATAQIDSLAAAKLIYISGGQQVRFMDVVSETPIFDAIHRAYRQGACIAGSSAGAAVMSELMITGDQLRDTAYNATFDKLLTDNIAFAPGLGLLTDAIIDQHFIKRSRYNRMISAAVAHPDKSVIGIDESTAIIVRGNQFSVVGESQVIVASAPQNPRSSPEGLIAFDDLSFKVLLPGDSGSF